MKKKIHKDCGIVFWITGLSGSGKSTIGKKVRMFLQKKFGKTLIIHGDEIRNIYGFKQYEKKSRLKLGKSNSNLCKLIADQGVNIIFTTVGLFHKLHQYNRANIKNYVEIYIKSDIKILLKKKKKIFYKNKSQLVWGLDLKTQFPKKPDITLENNFKISIQKLSKILIQKIDQKLNNTNKYLPDK